MAPPARVDTWLEVRSVKDVQAAFEEYGALEIQSLCAELDRRVSEAELRIAEVGNLSAEDRDNASEAEIEEYTKHRKRSPL